MSRRTIVLLAVAAGLGVVACSERQERLPAAPSFHGTTLPHPPTGCNISNLKTLVLEYFPSPRRFVVKDLVTDMDNAADFSPAARAKAFDIMAHVDTVVSANTAVGTPATGSNLVNGLIFCMYDPNVPAELAHRPTTFPEDFNTELTFGLHGAFGVRGGTSDPASAPVLSRPLATAFSGVAPGGTLPSWVATVIGNASPERVLIYGRPVPGESDHYEWKTLPHDATFNPGVVVGLCLDDVTFPTSMVEMQNAGVLPFQAVTFLPTGCSNTALLESGWGRTLASVARFGAELFGPRPLWATTTVSPGGLGGSAGGIRSEFGPLDLTATAGGVTLTFILQPPATVKVNQQFTVKVRATSGTSTVGGVSVNLEQFNDNGVPAILTGPNPVVTDESGVATFILSLNKPGAYRLQTTSQTTVVGRPAIAVTGTQSQKFNVKPK